MGHRVRMVIPSQENTGVADITERITKRWGGCTTTKGSGLWNPGGRGHPIVSELVTVCDTSIGVWGTKARDWWHDLAATVAELWDQECVYLSVQEETATLVDRYCMTRVIV